MRPTLRRGCGPGTARPRARLCASPIGVLHELGRTARTHIAGAAPDADAHASRSDGASGTTGGSGQHLCPSSGSLRPPRNQPAHALLVAAARGSLTAGAPGCALGWERFAATARFRPLRLLPPPTSPWRPRRQQRRRALRRSPQPSPLPPLPWRREQSPPAAAAKPAPWPPPIASSRAGRQTASAPRLSRRRRRPHPHPRRLQCRRRLGRATCREQPPPWAVQRPRRPPPPRMSAPRPVAGNQPPPPPPSWAGLAHTAPASRPRPPPARPQPSPETTSRRRRRRHHRLCHPPRRRRRRHHHLHRLRRADCGVMGSRGSLCGSWPRATPSPPHHWTGRRRCLRGSAGAAWGPGRPARWPGSP